MKDLSSVKTLFPMLAAAFFMSAGVSADTWQAAAPLVDSRREHAATMLLDGRVLVAGGEGEGNTAVRWAEVFDPATGVWTVTGPMDAARRSFTMTLLASGKVLVVGGRAFSADVATAELYDPSTGTWSDAAYNGESRREHTATLLSSGEVFVVGGYGDSAYRGSAMFFNPADLSWRTLAGTLNCPRKQHTATLLSNGKVLVGGGFVSGCFDTSVEIFDPANEGAGWTLVTPLNTGRLDHSATLLRDGRVLVVGGFDPFNTGIAKSVEVYAPGDAGGTWTALISTARSYDNHTATLLPSGKVLLAGSDGSELYDPADAGTPTLLSTTIPARFYQAAVLLPSGGVLMAAGFDLANSMSNTTAAWVYTTEHTGDPLAATNALTEGRTDHAATLLSNGKALVAGGDDGSGTKRGSVEVFTQNAGWITSPAALTAARSGAALTLLVDGRVLVTGGLESGDVPSTAVDLLAADGLSHDPAPPDPLNVARGRHTATLLANGQVLVAGGEGSDGNPVASVELYDPSNGSWTAAAPLHLPRLDHRAMLLPSGKVLVTGGLGPAAFMRSSAELYDPATNTWTTSDDANACTPETVPSPGTPCPLLSPRSLHAVTLLDSGRVLVTGGGSAWENDIADAEVYDPATGRWSTVAPLQKARSAHSMTLLPSGKVAVAGGTVNAAQLEVYDPATDAWTLAPASAPTRSGHTSTLLPSGDVLVVGGAGALADARLYHPLENVSDRPIVTSTSTSTLSYEVPFSISGQKFSSSEGGTGNSRQSAANHGLVKLQSLASSAPSWLTRGGFCSVASTACAADSNCPMAESCEFLPSATDLSVNMPPIPNPGWHLLTVLSEGMTSESKLVQVGCSLVITSQPQDQVAAVDETATFTVASQGGRGYQWQRNIDGTTWVNLNGATSTSYTTDAITSSEAGTRYRVEVKGGCMDATSAEAELLVDDSTTPTAKAPPSGDLWPLASTRTITWSMSDNIRVCKVELNLLASDDGGQSYYTVTQLYSEDRGSTCLEGITETSLDYEIPAAPPSGQAGSLYKVELTVTGYDADNTDGKNTTTVESESFHIFEPGETVSTVILWHSGRMLFPAPVPPATMSPEESRLRQALNDLARHADVEGLIFDLNGAELADTSKLDDLYAAWDGGTATANNVLFGTDPLVPGGIHRFLREKLAVLTEVKHVILVGGDNVIPMARLDDRTAAAASEQVYTTTDLTPDGTTVGRALAADKYLSDDPMATAQSLTVTDLDGALTKPFLADLVVGRLVETPNEIVASIGRFKSLDGVVELPGQTDKVLVSGYDFLVDSATRIGRRWRQHVCADPGNCPEVEATAFVEPPDWTWNRALPEFCPYVVRSLNGHATHYELGEPGSGPFDIQGLDTGFFDNVPAGECVRPGALVYAVGCHSGLPVSASGGAGDHVQDLPQTMLNGGALAFLGNTGYGWGLRYGNGYSERLVTLFTDEITAADTVTLGDAFRRAKRRYFLGATRFDAYDQKVLMEWTFYGFPMTVLRTKAAAGITSAPPRPFSGPPPSLDGLPSEENLGGVVVRREPLSSTFDDGVLVAPPDHLTRLDIRFDFTAAGVYRQLNAAGLEVPSEASADYCSRTAPAPAGSVPQGCYFTLNETSNLLDTSAGPSDRPIQPKFVYDSRLSGTSFHGVLFKGATHDEFADWVPLVAELQSNVDGTFGVGGVPLDEDLVDSSDGNSDEDEQGEDEQALTRALTGCPSSDLDVSSVVLETGELLYNPATGRQDVARRYRTVDMEVFYFNDAQDPAKNCDREGPVFDVADPETSFHQVNGLDVSWQVPVSDPAGVWRVVVTWDDGTGWTSLELDDGDGDGTWEGVVSGTDLAPGTTRIRYFVQAVDRRGNVTKQLHEPSALGLLKIHAVELVVGTADLAVSVGAPSVVKGLQPLSYSVGVTNLGPDVAVGVTVTMDLPWSLGDVFGGGSGWNCALAGAQMTCTRGTAVGPLPAITVLGTAPPLAGNATLTATVSATSLDLAAANDVDSATVLVLAAPRADLSVTQTWAFGIDGWSPSYVLSVTNEGPRNVLGVRVTDVFPAPLANVVWTCSASTGASCTPDGAGYLLDMVDLDAGSSVVYTVTSVLPDDFASQLVNTVTAEVPSGVHDPEPAPNSATTAIDYLALLTIFTDGFESGSTAAWTVTFGGVP